MILMQQPGLPEHHSSCLVCWKFELQGLIQAQISGVFYFIYLFI